MLVVQIPFIAHYIISNDLLYLTTEFNTEGCFEVLQHCLGLTCHYQNYASQILLYLFAINSTSKKQFYCIQYDTFKQDLNDIE